LEFHSVLNILNKLWSWTAHTSIKGLLPTLGTTLPVIRTLFQKDIKEETGMPTTGSPVIPLSLRKSVYQPIADEVIDQTESK
jgi:hypothetical protein